VGSLLLSLLVVGLGLGVLLYAGSLFLQGYVYTEPSGGLFWQAPAAAAALLLFFVFWCLMVANSATATITDIPYDTIFRFSPKEDLAKSPVGEIVAVRKDGKETVYKLRKQPNGPPEYLDKRALELGGPRAPSWNPENVKAIRLKFNDQDMTFDLTPTGQGANRQFVNAATGYMMTEYDRGPTGIPIAFRWGRFYFNLFLNFFHLALWFLCLWLLMRFQWGHALGLAMVFWLIFTLALLPMLLQAAAEVAVEKRSPTGGKSARLQPTNVEFGIAAMAPSGACAPDLFEGVTCSPGCA